MWDQRIVIPEECRARVLEINHELDMGIVKFKALARSYVRARVDETGEAACRKCAFHTDQPPRHTPRA